jgi:hypothetical protein
MGRMADSSRRRALAAMFVLAVVDAFLVLAALLAGGWALAATVAGLAATLAALAGLALQSRRLILGGVTVQAAVAASLLGVDRRYVYLLLLVALAGLFALAAALEPEPVEVAPSTAPAGPATPWATAALLAMSCVALVSVALLGVAFRQGGLTIATGAWTTGVVGLAGALTCLYALREGRGSLAASAALTQAVFSTALFLLFGLAGQYGAVHLLIVGADVLTLRAALGPGLRTPRSATPRRPAQG